MKKPNINKSVKLDMQRRIAILVTMDILCILCAFFLGLWLRFDFRFGAIPHEYLSAYFPFTCVWCAVSVAVYAVCRLYHSMWRFASVDELLHIIGAYVVLAAVGGVYLLVTRNRYMPYSFYVLGFAFSFIAVVCVRFSYRLMRGLKTQLNHMVRKGDVKNIMIIGAGEAGRILVNEFENNKFASSRVVCVIDDNPMKKNKRLCGVPIVGNRYDIHDAVVKYGVNSIVFAIPASKASDKKAILDICATTGCEVQVLPSIYQIANGEVSVSKLRDVDVQDLLGREPIKVNLDEIMEYISGKVVMVTGGGGSIGSELCRQIARANPKQLIIFDIYENNAYDIQMELKRTCPELNLEVLIGSVRNTARLDYVLGHYRPELVFHAAAHKHVPLMEDSPNEAIKNNVFGTYKLAQAAAKYGVKRFVLISTDKAVNPTNIMGASKRLCEMVVQMMDRKSPETEFVAVRFGNVLGSNGSVIPLFKKQIAEGGPVTVTHPDIIRYFMTIPEAVSLVLQAGYYAKGGEIFVLDMGDPVKIDDMARNLIRFSGFEPDVDIEIVYTGLRPGEKLFEELLMDEEGLRETSNKLIHVGRPIEMDDELFLKQLDRLDAAYRVEDPNMKQLVAEIVPTYKPDTNL
ncbi:MAG: polysaccharide biosynthesis protein [Oscillospiraceae bacterium]|nr:polysaccharide biosynthesis protein [Oscillospiraceae bacterium]